MRGVFRSAIVECRKRHELGADVPECLLQHARLALFADDLYDSVDTYCLAFLHDVAAARLVQELRYITQLRERVQADPSEPRVVSLRVGLECVESLLRLMLQQRAIIGKARLSNAENKQPQRFVPGPVVLAGGCEAMSVEHEDRAGDAECRASRIRGHHHLRRDHLGYQRYRRKGR